MHNIFDKYYIYSILIGASSILYGLGHVSIGMPLGWSIGAAIYYGTALIANRVSPAPDPVTRTEQIQVLERQIAEQMERMQIPRPTPTAPPPSGTITAPEHPVSGSISAPEHPVSGSISATDMLRNAGVIVERDEYRRRYIIARPVTAREQSENEEATEDEITFDEIDIQDLINRPHQGDSPGPR